MAPGTKDSSPRAGGWDKNYKLATAASNAMGRAPSHPPRTAGRGRIQQRLIWKDGIKADSRPVTQSLPETYKELLIYQQHTNRYTRHDGAGPPDFLHNHSRVGPVIAGGATRDFFWSCSSSCRSAGIIAHRFCKHWARGRARPRSIRNAVVQAALDWESMMKSSSNCDKSASLSKRCARLTHTHTH